MCARFEVGFWSRKHTTNHNKRDRCTLIVGDVEEGVRALAVDDLRAKDLSAGEGRSHRDVERRRILGGRSDSLFSGILKSLRGVRELNGVGTASTWMGWGRS